MLSVIALRNLLGFCLSSLVVLSGGSQVGVNPRFDDSSLKLSLFGKKIRLACNETFLVTLYNIEILTSVTGHLQGNLFSVKIGGHVEVFL